VIAVIKKVRDKAGGVHSFLKGSAFLCMQKSRLLKRQFTYTIYQKSLLIKVVNMLRYCPKILYFTFSCVINKKPKLLEHIGSDPLKLEFLLRS